MVENPEETANAEQARYWQSDVGRKWVDQQEALDRSLAPVSTALFERARPAAGERVLDLGCGTGATTLALAELVGGKGRVTGLDISSVLLAKAKARVPPALAPRIAFVEADAQTWDPGAERFDLLLSRFGSMFFADPPAAFRKLRQALRPGARMHLAAWAPLGANPWFVVARDAAIARLGPPPPADPKAPGPLAFADTGYVLGILEAAGFAKPAAEVVKLELEPPGNVHDVAALALTIGPAVRLIAHYQGTPADAEAIGKAIEKGFARYATNGAVRIPATLNLFAAVAP
ncbi:MAG TPA: class I SAM-dependent methyltransferase [Kiloniellales bacterium]|nr:class I SAM-dependent methyltransferase [Kiloniellales bacterium]